MKLQGQKLKFEHEKQLAIMTLMAARAKTERWTSS